MVNLIIRNDYQVCAVVSLLSLPFPGLWISPCCFCVRVQAGGQVAVWGRQRSPSESS